MALKTYVGARYAPKFMGAWDKSSEYAALSVVYTNDRSFVSRKTVPANTEILNTEYWIQSSDWNAQVAEYNELVQQYHDATEEYNKNVEAYNTAVSKFYADTLHSYRTKAEMVADASLKLEDTVLTCGDKAIGDTGGSFYRIVDKTSSKAVALENGLFAEPFEFQPYDYSEFATKTDEYKTQTDEQIQQYKETTDQQITNYKNSTDQSYTQFTAGINNTVNTFTNDINNSVAQMKKVSLHNYDTVAQMKTDTSLVADTTVLTSGQDNLGDNLGSFYRVANSSSRADAVTLNNGKKAVPFVVQGGLAAGSQLNFLGQANVPNVWNTKAGQAITVPINNVGETASTVFLGILYTASNQATTVTLNINNGNYRTLTISDSGSANSNKTVVYALSARYTGDTYYFGYTTVTSWNLNLNAVASYTETTIGKSPITAPVYTAAAPITGGVLPNITVSSNVELASITFVMPAADHRPKDGGDGVSLVDVTSDAQITLASHEFTANDYNKTYTLDVNKTLTPGRTYRLNVYFGATPPLLTGYWWANSNVTAGTFGPFTISASGDSDSFGFSGTLRTVTYS